MKEMAICPVCKAEVYEKTAKFKSKYRRKNYYCCCAGCKKAFDENPEKYIVTTPMKDIY